MKRIEAIALFNVLGTVKVNKMDETLAGAVLDNHLEVHKVKKSYDEAQEVLSKRVLDGISQERQQEHSELTNKRNAEKDATKQAEIQAIINDSYSDIEAANRKFNKVITKFLTADVIVNLTKIGRKEFIKGCKDAGMDVKPDFIQILAPMFEDYTEPKDNKEAVSKELDTLMSDDE